MDNMIPVALFFADGRAFFLAAVLVCLAAVGTLFQGRGLALFSRLALLAAAILVVFSAAPLAWWLSALWGAGGVLLFIETLRTRRVIPRWRAVTAAFAVLVTLAIVIAETQYAILPRVSLPCDGRIVVIGDSISAGVNDDIPTWPQLLQRMITLEVIDLSRAGETTASAFTQMDDLPPAAPYTLFLVEIGGNDMLAGRPVKEFEAHLDALLSRIASDGAVVVMMELPLPPLQNGYGRAQRALAARHGAILAPKRCLSRVIGHREATLDGLHLSARGHEMMAQVFAAILDLNCKTPCALQPSPSPETAPQMPENNHGGRQALSPLPPWHISIRRQSRRAGGLFLQCL